MECSGCILVSRLLFPTLAFGLCRAGGMEEERNETENPREGIWDGERSEPAGWKERERLSAVFLAGISFRSDPETQHIPQSSYHKLVSDPH